MLLRGGDHIDTVVAEEVADPEGAIITAASRIEVLVLLPVSSGSRVAPPIEITCRLSHKDVRVEVARHGHDFHAAAIAPAAHEDAVFKRAVRVAFVPSDLAVVEVGDDVVVAIEVEVAGGDAVNAPQVFLNQVAFAIKGAVAIVGVPCHTVIALGREDVEVAVAVHVLEEDLLDVDLAGDEPIAGEARPTRQARLRLVRPAVDDVVVRRAAIVVVAPDISPARFGDGPVTEHARSNFDDGSVKIRHALSVLIILSPGCNCSIGTQGDSNGISGIDVNKVVAAWRIIQVIAIPSP